jgi:hypothetical protein
MIIFRDPVSLTQAFGYSIALGGLVYYKLGADKLKDYMLAGRQAWADYGVRHPAIRRLIIFGTLLVIFLLMLGGVAPRIDPEYPSTLKNQFGSMLGNSDGTVTNAGAH